MVEQEVVDDNEIQHKKAKKVNNLKDQSFLKKLVKYSLYGAGALLVFSFLVPLLLLFILIAVYRNYTDKKRPIMGMVTYIVSKFKNFNKKF